jgi:two-component system, OmpR family, phosphate regulon sensor histidine kinase PhoR
MKRKTAIFFYVLGGYVLLQFSWWAYHLIELTQINVIADKDVSRKVLMILSEGLVFFAIIIIGLWQIRKSIKKELKLSERQKNFLLSVTHELKTPLASNKLFLQTIKKRDLDEEKRNDLLDKAISENVRLENMIDNILNATRIEHNTVYINREIFNLETLLNTIVERFQRVYNAKNIHTNIAKGLWVKADSAMIETVIVNLIENALKYAGENGEIYVNADKKGADVWFSIEDNGPGVPSKLKNDIFEKFVRSGNEDTRTKKGTGLGLYISKEFVHLNRGNIVYKNRVPNGAIFEVTLHQS